MKDIYPALPGLPADHLVPPELQPDYLESQAFVPACNLTEALADRHVAAGYGEMVAIIHHESGRTLTFSELSEESARLANALIKFGCRPGDRVAFRSANRPEAIITALAAWRLGAIVVPIPVQAREEEISFFLHDTGAKFLVVDARPGAVDAIAPGIRGTEVKTVIGFGTADHEFHDWTSVLDAADATYDGPSPHLDTPALIWHTGGTTGTPKACYHTQRRFFLGGEAAAQAIGVGPNQRWAAAAPLGHALGFIYHTNFTLQHRATVVLIEQFGDPACVLRAIDEHQIDTFTSVVAGWSRLKEAIQAADSTAVGSSLRKGYGMWQSASAAEVVDWWQDRGVELLNNFGSTSFATWVLAPRAGEIFPRGALGRPSPGFVVEAIDPDFAGVVPVAPGAPGRMAVRGVTGLTYWNRPEMQARDVVDGWTLVDDIIAFDDHGNASYLGRTDFLISTAGYKVAPVEVETVLSRHPGVLEVAVLGAPDAIRQEVVAAFVALKDGWRADDDLKRELQQLVKSKLAPYKYPRIIEWIDALPRDHLGKVQPKVLLAQTSAVTASPQDPTPKSTTS